jgi:hypothetical protein
MNHFRTTIFVGCLFATIAGLSTSCRNGRGGQGTSNGGAGGGGSGGSVDPTQSGGGGAEPAECEGCASPQVCVDGLECAASCPTERAMCHTATDDAAAFSCCAVGEQCCAAAVYGYATDECRPAGETCPLVCPDGTTTCSGEQFCSLDSSGTYSCADGCNPLYACGKTCCPLGASCEDGGCRLPDLTVDAPYVQETAFTDQQSFAPGSCEIVEGCVAAAGNRKLLHFALRTPNLGPGQLLLGNPAGNPLFEFSPCHQHFHYNGYASYRLLKQDMTVAALGHKQSFCLYDLDKWDPNATTTATFTCDYQGLSVGWADTYNTDLPCQWVDVTGVPAGNYLLEITVNGDQTLAETDYGNNVVVVPVTVN